MAKRRRRRSRGFAGSPAEHKKSFLSQLTDASYDAISAHNISNTGDCYGSLTKLISANRNFATAIENMRGAHVTDIELETWAHRPQTDVDGVANKVQFAFDSFVRACVRK